MHFGDSSSADARQLLARQQIHDSARPKGCSHSYQTGNIVSHCADDVGVPAQRVSTHRGPHIFGAFRRNNRNQLSFIRNIERIEAQQLTDSPHLLTNRNSFFFHLDTHSGLPGNLVERRGKPAARGIPKTSNAA
jgi:tRNA U38,U39,U40 pseudouridine synthase TruA